MPEDKDNIISLAERRSKKGRGEAANEAERPEPTGAGAEADGAPDAGDQGLEPLPGKITWLYCPACKTLQYTEVWLPGGRVHNVCGNQVEQAEVEIDVRAETTIAEINLERLRMLEQMIAAERGRFEEYQKRLALIAGGPPRPYPLDEATLERLPVAEVGALGLLAPTALHDPISRFAGAQAGPPPETSPPEATPPASGPPKP